MDCFSRIVSHTFNVVDHNPLGGGDRISIDRTIEAFLWDSQVSLVVAI